MNAVSVPGFSGNAATFKINQGQLHTWLSDLEWRAHSVQSRHQRIKREQHLGKRENSNVTDIKQNTVLKERSSQREDLWERLRVCLVTHEPWVSDRTPEMWAPQIKLCCSPKTMGCQRLSETLLQISPH